MNVSSTQMLSKCHYRVDSGLPIPSAKSPLARQTQGRSTGIQVETQLITK